MLIERGSKIAFVGQNGQGNLRLLRSWLVKSSFDGELKLGHNVQIGYFAQNQSEYLEGELTILETMENEATDGNRVRDSRYVRFFSF